MMAPIKSALAICALIAAAVAAPTERESMGISFINHHNRPIFISGDWAQKDLDNKQISKPGSDPLSLDTKLAPGKHTFFPGFASASPKFFVSTTPAQACIGEKRDHDTAIEITWRDYSGKTFYDVDVERGTSVPIWCHGRHEEWQSGMGCEGDVLRDCPPHLTHTHGDNGRVDQCRGENTTEDINRRFAKCPTSYISADDARTHVMAEGHGKCCRSLNFTQLISLDLICWILSPTNTTRTHVHAV